jgi:PAS domain S-box-containing protein
MLEGCQLVGFDWKYIYVNAAASRHARRAASELIGRTMQKCHPGIATTVLFEKLRHCMKSRQGCDLNYEFTSPDGARTAYEIGIRPVPEGLLILSHETTPRNDVERPLSKARKCLMLELEGLARIHKISVSLARDNNLNRLLRRIVNAAMTITGANMCSLHVLDPNTGQLKTTAQQGFRVPCQKICGGLLSGHAPCSLALKLGRRVIIGNVARTRMVGSAETRAQMIRSGVRAVQTTLLQARSGKTVGVLTTHYAKLHWPPDQELRLLDLLARQASDLIERITVGDELRRSEGQLARAQELAQVGSYERDPTRRTTFWSAQIYRILGWDPARRNPTFKEYVNKLIHPGDRLRFKDALRKTLREGTKLDLEYRIRRPNGALVHIHSIEVPEMNRDGKVTRLIGTIQDITERKILQQELLDISEREQRRFGQDLHDTLGQRLTGLEMLSHALARDLAEYPTELRQQALRLNEELRETTTQARLISHGLAPITLRREGLTEGLAKLAAATGQVPGVKCIFIHSRAATLNDIEAATHLYRIAQEAVSNALKHAKATTICISLHQKARILTLRIENNGLPIPSPLPEKRGMGIDVMRYRASMIGARFSIESNSKNGARVTCVLRLPGKNWGDPIDSIHSTPGKH